MELVVNKMELVKKTSLSINFFFFMQNLLVLRFVLVPCRVQAAVPRGNVFLNKYSTKIMLLCDKNEEVPNCPDGKILNEN